MTEVIENIRKAKKAFYGPKHTEECVMEEVPEIDEEAEQRKADLLKLS